MGKARFQWIFRRSLGLLTQTFKLSRFELKLTVKVFKFSKGPVAKRRSLKTV